MLREEELKWYQRAKTKGLLEGDANTKFFHLVANGKHRKTRIFKLQAGDRVITGDVELKRHITSYYKSLFGDSEDTSLTLEHSRVEDIPQISPEENDKLVADFTKDEIKDAVFQMEHNKAPGPDGFPAEFYQFFWDVIKDDLMAMFKDFSLGCLPIHSLNFGTIVLLPKLNDAIRIEQYRPICLLNVSFKIFTKTTMNRLSKVAHKVINPTQTAFLPGRNIMEGVVILHETLHELHRKKQNGVVFKIDFEKAYDKIRWSFVRQTLQMKGFSEKWCDWISAFTQKGHVNIKINDQLSNNFQTKKGLRQGDPLSPVLFNIVVDMLAILINRAKREGHIEGVVPHLVDDGLSILQYADDTILFMNHDIAKTRNLKLILCAFEQLSGLKINYHKSEIFCFGEAKNHEQMYSSLFGCKSGSYPFRYLGIPMHYRKLRKADWNKVLERIEKKLSSWKGKHLSTGGRLVLINSVLSSLPLYMMSFFEIPRKVLEKIEYLRSRFYWQAEEQKRKYRLARWSILCQPKDIGGLGIKNIDVQNKCLLCKWLFKLINEDGIWQQILRRKYFHNKSIGQVVGKPGDSHFWAGLMKVKELFLSQGKFVAKSGSNVRFWEDKWLGDFTLQQRFPSLYNIARRKHTLVSSVFISVPLNVSFRRGLYGDTLGQWNALVALLLNVSLNNEKDIFHWSLKQDGVFTVQSLYSLMICNGHAKQDQTIWKIKIPLKIKIFAWYLRRGVILTKDNLAKRNWNGSKLCVLCGARETIQHLFFECHFARFIWRVVSLTFGLRAPYSIEDLFSLWLQGIDPKLRLKILVGAVAICWAIWTSRNDVVFDKTPIKTYMQVLYRGTYWCRFWALLQKREEDAKDIKDGCRQLETLVMQIFASHGWQFSNRIAL